ncbi:hypothetical protein ABT336_13255 [Micromonospora sp. NPDC000207]|uniref:hypothetical protein n=1 Tax=Micromonospora sp. NPDC000207 TaxID=3154246 RepID=UPI00332B3788
MAARNPNPTNISNALWAVWTGFGAAEPTALLGGILANKPGYHNRRNAVKTTDYSSGRDVVADKQGSGELSAGLDLTMSTAAMIKHTRRLDVAARARDSRLYTARGPIIREFIGTLDGRVVYCYVLTGGKALGVGADAGPDPGRDKSHLWHLHISIIRAFAADAAALDGLLSVLLGEPLAAYQKRTQPAPTPAPKPTPVKEDDMPTAADVAKYLMEQYRTPDGRTLAGSLDALLRPRGDNALGRQVTRSDSVPAARPPWQNGDYGDPAKPDEGNKEWTVGYTLQTITERGRANGVQISEILAMVAQIAGRDPVDEPAIISGVLSGLTPEKIAAAIPTDMARQVADELGRRFNTSPSQTQG